MNNNIRVEYRASLGKIVMLVYDGNGLVDQREYKSWDFEYLPESVQVHFKLDIPKYD